jgi:hypothetical protein
VQIFYSDHYALPLPPGHRFPMSKYARLRGRVLESEFGARCRVAPAARDEEIVLAHCPDYLHRVAEGTLSAGEQRAIGFPWTPQMVERSRRPRRAPPPPARAAAGAVYLGPRIGWGGRPARAARRSPRRVPRWTRGSR